MNIRKAGFLLKDSLSGGKAKKYIREVKEGIETSDSSLVDKQLERLLKHAVCNVDFYKERVDSFSLEDFPVINKNIIRENFDKFRDHSFNEKKLFKESTSGSTGTPLIVYQDPNKRRRASADTFVFSALAGYEIGARLYYSRVWNNLNKKNKIVSWIQNIVMWDSSKLSDEDIEAFLRELEKDNREKSVLIFASSLVSLYRYMFTHNRKSSARVSCFITMSESLPENVRKGIAEFFNTTVVARYSNCECGIMAQHCPHCNEFHINKASFHIELLKLDADEPAECGEPGRIVVTDLYNFAMPIIRYDTGDIGVMAKVSECGLPGPVFTRIDGRRTDFLYSASDELLSPYVINNTMWRFQEISQYQLIQNGKGEYVLKLNTDGSKFLREEEMLGELKKYLGINADISIEYVDEIPVLNSGKRKQVICNHSPN